ncbi:MAG: peptidoglycan-binding protein [Myxococcota bacterium]
MALSPLRDVAQSYGMNLLEMLAQGITPGVDNPKQNQPEPEAPAPQAAPPQMRQPADTGTQAGARQMARGQGTGLEQRMRNSYTPAPSLEAVREGRASLSRGVQGDSVRHLQEQLNRSGAQLDVDGKFGPKTEAALRQFQQGQGQDPSGRADANTLSSLQSASPQSTPPSSRAPSRTQQRQPQRPAAQRPARNQPRQPTRTGETPRNNPRQPAQTGETTRTNPTSTRGNPPNGTATFDRVSRAGQRNQMVEGRITVNGRTYNFRSGGHGRGNLPPGQYTVTRHMDQRSDRSMNVGGVGYSFALNDKYDPRVGANRSLLRIHPDGGTPGTMGCIGIVGDAATQRRFREDMLAELRRNGGRFTLTVR